MVGKVFFGKYLIIREIGKGGMSSIFLAENIRLGNQWAIKRIEKNNSKINLLAEPRILKDLNHPLIPQIIDIEEDEQYLYIIEEYVKGINLKDYKNNNKQIKETDIINIALQICDVLEYLHSRKPYPIIYRDIKPSNIILTEGNRIKLIDFGISRKYKNDSNADTVLLGTRGYAAPEQYGSGQSDVRTDIYSFGVTLYFLITGNNLNTIHKDIIIGRYSDTLKNIIERCTRIQPNERYQSITHIKEELIQLKQEKEKKTYKVYSGVKQKTIGVLSLTKRAGSTFFATNLATAIADKDFLVSLIELPFNEAYIYDLIGISNYIDLDYYSIINEINEDNHVDRDKIALINNIMYLVKDATKQEIDNWDDNKTIKLIYSAKESLISIVDIGYNYDEIENIITEFDLIYAIYNAMPPDIMANYNLFKKIQELNKRNNKIRFVLNNDNIGINKNVLTNYLGIKPDVVIPNFPSELVYKTAYKKKFPYSEPIIKKILDENFKSIYKELLPKGISDKYNKRKYGRFYRFKNKYNYTSG
ncbi:MAG: serine/threonine protein kinase [Vallitalea sp.]|jgi:serine/threonine-protein kinase|nr:serine/threonine protein kinase [Vallitalea sp.]